VIKEAQGARYEISVDGTVRPHRDTREAALEAANVLKALNPYGKIVIRDLQTGADAVRANPRTSPPGASNTEWQGLFYTPRNRVGCVLSCQPRTCRESSRVNGQRSCRRRAFSNSSQRLSVLGFQPSCHGGRGGTAGMRYFPGGHFRRLSLSEGRSRE
jgi:hypothetical protein